MSDKFGATSGALTGDTATTGQTWASAGGVTDGDDFTETAAPDNAVIRTAVSDTSTAINWGRQVVLGSATPTDVAVQVSLSSTATGAYQGVIARLVDNANYLFGYYFAIGSVGKIAVARFIGGSLTTLGVTDTAVGYATTKTIRLTARASGAWEMALDGNKVLSGTDSTLGAGGALASGKSGMHDFWFSPTVNTRTYSNFKVSIPPAESIALNAGRKAEFRDDGTAWRQDSTGTYYGYPQQQTIPVAPQLGPSSHGQPANRILALTSRNNPDLASDPAWDPFVLRVYARRRYAVSRWED